MRIKPSFIVVLLHIVFLSFSCGGAVDKESTESTILLQVTTDGKVLYAEKCAMCHGENGNLGTMGAANLVSSKINSESVLAIIRNGKNGMRSFAQDFSDEQLNAVAKYVEQLRK